MATGFINPGDLATGGGAPTGFTERWGTGIAVEANVSALYGKDIKVDGDSPSLFSIDALDGVADTEVVALLRISPDMPLDARAGVWARVPSATAEGSYSGYLGCLRGQASNQIQIVEYSAASTVASNAETTNSWTVDTLYWVRYRITGTSLQLRFWADGVSEPGTWDLDATDSSFSAGGWCGLGWNLTGNTRSMYVEALGWATAGDTAPTEDAGTQLATPSNFSFSAASSSLQLDGSWNPVADADTYDWQVERDDLGSWVAFQSGNTASTSFQLTDVEGVAWSKTYRSRVRSVPPAV